MTTIYEQKEEKALSPLTFKTEKRLVLKMGQSHQIWYERAQLNGGYSTSYSASKISMEKTYFFFISLFVCFGDGVEW